MIKSFILRQNLVKRKPRHITIISVLQREPSLFFQTFTIRPVFIVILITGTFTRFLLCRWEEGRHIQLIEVLDHLRLGLGKVSPTEWLQNFCVVVKGPLWYLDLNFSKHHGNLQFNHTRVKNQRILVLKDVNKKQ